MNNKIFVIDVINDSVISTIFAKSDNMDNITSTIFAIDVIIDSTNNKIFAIAVITDNITSTIFAKSDNMDNTNNKIFAKSDNMDNTYRKYLLERITLMSKIFQYAMQPQYSLIKEYSSPQEAAEDNGFEAKTAIRSIRENAQDNKNEFVRSYRGFYWTNTPLENAVAPIGSQDNVSAYKEEEKPQLDPDELRETIDYMSSINGSMRMGAWYFVNEQFSPLFETFKTSMRQLIYEWAVQGNFCKRLQSLQPQGQQLRNMRIVSHLPFASKEDLREELIKHLHDCNLIID